MAPSSVMAGNLSQARKGDPERGAALAQPTPAWLRSTGRVAQNIAAADLTRDAHDLARIAEIAPDGGLGGCPGTARTPHGLSRAGGTEGPGPG